MMRDSRQVPAEGPGFSLYVRMLCASFAVLHMFLYSCIWVAWLILASGRDVLKPVFGITVLSLVLQKCVVNCIVCASGKL